MFTCFLENTPTLSCLKSQNVCSHPTLSTSRFMVRRLQDAFYFPLYDFWYHQPSQPLCEHALSILFNTFALLSFLSYPIHPHIYIFSLLLLCVIILLCHNHLYISLISPLPLLLSRPSTSCLTYDDGL